MMTRAAELRSRFRAMHHDPPAAPTPGILVMPNPWDIGSARVLEATGALALATTSSGHAATLGRNDQHVERDELVAHAAALAAAVDVPLNVDAEDGLAADLDEVARTYDALADTDAAGASIEDYDPRAGAVRPVADAVERVATARAACADMVLTARCENLLYGAGDLDDTIERLVAYRDAGAHVAYAPGVTAIEDIRRIVEAVGIPVNVLALPGTPPLAELADAGVARVSTGGALAWIAYGALARAATALLTTGAPVEPGEMLPREVRGAAFGARP
jgi:2-methylisocitrate lyase-like PEP mutase family enzyme